MTLIVELALTSSQLPVHYRERLGCPARTTPLDLVLNYTDRTCLNLGNWVQFRFRILTQEKWKLHAGQCIKTAMYSVEICCRFFHQRIYIRIYSHSPTWNNGRHLTKSLITFTKLQLPWKHEEKQSREHCKTSENYSSTMNIDYRYTELECTLIINSYHNSLSNETKEDITQSSFSHFSQDGIAAEASMSKSRQHYKKTWEIYNAACGLLLQFR